ncbi:hypothetical protein [Streptomyces sp. NPDC013455]|uniref:hypothetical protein n=1 Tax=Streptomyces sp. NPDC013455 TaxID=3155605 RepID=UPI0033C03D04
MVTEFPDVDVTSSETGLLDRVGTLRSDADLMEEYARRLSATAATLAESPAAPEWSRPTLEQQAAACRTAAERLRTAAEALLAHARGGNGGPLGGNGGPARGNGGPVRGNGGPVRGNGRPRRRNGS